MGLLDTLFSNLRWLHNDVLMPARPNTRFKTTAIPVTDEPSYDATQLDFTGLEAEIDAAEASLVTAEADIATLQSQIATADPGGAAARYVWQPGGTTAGSTFTDFQTCVTQALVSGHVVHIVLDDSAGALTMPGVQVDMGGRVKLFADHDVTLDFGNNAELLNCAGTVTEGNATIETDITGALGGEPWTYSGTFPSTRIPEFSNTDYTLTTGSRRFMDLAAITAVSFDGGDITDLVCAALTCHVRGAVTISADPFIASGAVTVNYYDRTSGPTAPVSVTGVFTEVNLFDEDSTYVELVFQPSGTPTVGTFTTLAELQVGITAAVNRGKRGTVIFDGSQNSGLIEINAALDFASVFSIRVLASVTDVQHSDLCTNPNSWVCDRAVHHQSVGTYNNRMVNLTSAAVKHFALKGVHFVANSSNKWQFLLATGSSELEVLDLNGCSCTATAFVWKSVAGNLEVNSTNTRLHNYMFVDAADDQHLSINTDDPNAEVQVNWNNTGATQAFNHHRGAGALPEPSTIALYNFDGDGTKDTSGNGRDLTFAAAAAFAPGHYLGSQAWRADSTSRATSSDAVFRTDVAVSVEAMVFIETAVTAHSMIVCCGILNSTTSTDNVAFSINLHSNRQVMWYQEAGAGVDDSVQSGNDAVPLPGEWFHVAGTRSAAGTTVNLYVNGVLVKSGAITAGAAGSNADLTIGAQQSGGFGADDMLIDDVAVYATELSASAVALHAKRALGALGSGTFIPEFDFATSGDVSTSYTNQSGSYRVENGICHFRLRVEGTVTHTTAAGALYVRGLPFDSEGTEETPVSLGWSGNVTGANRAGQVGGDNYLLVYKTTAVTAQAADVATGVNTRLEIAGSYIIA